MFHLPSSRRDRRKRPRFASIDDAEPIAGPSTARDGLQAGLAPGQNEADLHLDFWTDDDNEDSPPRRQRRHFDLNTEDPLFPDPSSDHGARNPKVKRARVSFSTTAHSRGSTPADAPTVAGPSHSQTPVKSLLPGVLEVFPDICPTWAMQALQESIDRDETENIRRVVELVVEMTEGYPRAAASSSTTIVARDTTLDTMKYKDPRFRKAERCGESYRISTLVALEHSFPRMPIKQ